MAFIPPQKRTYRVVSNRPIAEGQFELSFVPTDGLSMFPFTAGQWVMLELPDPSGGKAWKSAYSISNAPHEAGQGFQVAVKRAGDFTKRLEALCPGEEIVAQGPYGVFTLRAHERPIVIFAGGVGFTPFRSMVRSLVETKDPRPVILFYSNRKESEIAYAHEFRELADTHPLFKPIFILTREAPDGWEGESRRLDREMLYKYVPDLQVPEFLACGPTVFMDHVRDLLAAEGVDLKAQFRKELFD